MRKIIVILTAFLLLTQIATGADHPGQRYIRGRADGWMSIHKDGPYSAEWIAAAGLNLTAEQNARIRTMEEKWTRQFEPLQSRWYETRKELKAEWLKTEIDRRRIDVLQDEVAGLRERMREKIADRRAEVLEILTAEQRARVEDAEQIRDVYHNWIWYRTTRERR